MNQKAKKIAFRLGTAGKLAHLVVAAAMIGWAAFSQSNVNGYVLAFFAALVTGVVFAKDEKAYGEALVYGLGKPMFAIIVLAVILAAVSGKLISASGAVQTIAVYVVEAGFTGKLFVAASFLITCLLAFATGTSVGTYFVVIPILFPVGVLAGAAPEFMIGAIVSGAAFGDNLGPISDTTIASSATQHADLGTVVKTRTRYSLPAAAGALVLFLLFSSILNVVLDICFVKWMANGVRAVACATILSQLTALIICSVYTIRGRELFRMKKEDRVIDRDCVMALLRMGVPMAAQASITQVGFLALQSAINTFGVNVIAGYTAGNKLEQFCLQPLNAFGAAMAVYVGQNYGARKKERIREGVLASVLLAMGTAFLLGGTLRGFGTGLLGLFVESSDREVMSYGLQYVNTFSLFLWGVASILLFRNILQGMTNVAVPMTVGALELIARIVWVIFLYRKGTYGMLCLVNPVTWVIAAVPLITGYFWMMHRKEKWE